MGISMVCWSLKRRPPSDTCTHQMNAYKDWVFDVQYKGISYETIPTALYKATTPDGFNLRVSVSFISDKGDVTNNVSEAIWKWVQRPGSEWYALQRISPWNLNDVENNRWERAVIAAMDISSTHPIVQPIKFNGGDYD